MAVRTGGLRVAWARAPAPGFGVVGVCFPSAVMEQRHARGVGVLRPRDATLPNV